MFVVYKPLIELVGNCDGWVVPGLFLVYKPLTEFVGSYDVWVAGGGRRNATTRQQGNRTTRQQQQLFDVVHPPTMHTGKHKPFGQAPHSNFVSTAEVLLILSTLLIQQMICVVTVRR